MRVRLPKISKQDLQEIENMPLKPKGKSILVEPQVRLWLAIKPIELREANKFIIELHRHHDKVQGHKFSLGCFNEEKLVGVAVCGRPVSRKLDNGRTLEVTRLCTDSTKNVVSKLLSACKRTAEAMGFEKIQTYILENETGISLKASGWYCEDDNCGGKAWNSSGAIVRTDFTETLFEKKKKYPNMKKQRWVRWLNNSKPSA